MCEKVNQKHVTSKEQMLRRLRLRAAKEELCSFSARQSMLRAGIDSRLQQQILETLREEKFIDDERYARAFVREKLRLSKWGLQKIRQALRQKGIAAQMIEAALEEGSGEDFKIRLQTVLEAKMRTLKAKSAFERKAKLVRYAVGQGYAMQDAMEVVASLVKTEEDEVF